MGNSFKKLSRFSGPSFADDEPLEQPPLLEESKEEATFNIVAYGKFGFNYLQLSSSQTQEIPCTVNLQCSGSSEMSSTGVDLVCVIDISGSMQGEKLDLVKATLNFIVERLTIPSRMCVITFNNAADKCSSLVSLNQQAKQQLKQVINNLTARGGTNIVSGLEYGLQVLLQRRQVNNTSAILLLTDGQDNNQDTVQERVNACLAQGKSSAYSIHTFGYGRNHDPNLLVNIAELRHGGFYYVSDEDTVATAFANCLGELVSCTADQIEVKITTKKAPIPYSLSKIYSDSGDTKFSLPPLLLNDKKEAVFVVKFLPTQDRVDNEQDIQLLTFQVKYRLVSTGQVIQEEYPIHLRVENEDFQGEIEVDSDVMVNFYRMKVADIMNQATQIAERGQFEEARELLTAGQAELEASLVRDNNIIQALANDLLRSVELYKNQQAWNNEGRHMMNMRAKNHTSKRGMEMEFYQNSEQVSMISSAKAFIKKR